MTARPKEPCASRIKSRTAVRRSWKKKALRRVEGLKLANGDGLRQWDKDGDDDKEKNDDADADVDTNGPP